MHAIWLVDLWLILDHDQTFVLVMNGNVHLVVYTLVLTTWALSPSSWCTISQSCRGQKNMGNQLAKPLDRKVIMVILMSFSMVLDSKACHFHGVQLLDNKINERTISGIWAHSWNFFHFTVFLAIYATEYGCMTLLQNFSGPCRRQWFLWKKELKAFHMSKDTLFG